MEQWQARGDQLARVKVDVAFEPGYQVQHIPTPDPGNAIDSLLKGLQL
jgi:hypothetical protein